MHAASATPAVQGARSPPTLLLPLAIRASRRSSRADACWCSIGRAPAGTGQTSASADLLARAEQAMGRSGLSLHGEAGVWASGPTRRLVLLRCDILVRIEADFCFDRIASGERASTRVGDCRSCESGGLGTGTTSTSTGSPQRLGGRQEGSPEEHAVLRQKLAHHRKLGGSVVLLPHSRRRGQETESGGEHPSSP